MKYSIYFLLLAVLAISGCASTKITGYSDPAYKSKTYESVFAFASNVGLEQASELEGAICENFQDKGIKCSPFQLMFPPTRQHAPDVVFESLQKKNFNSILILTVGGDYSSSEVFGYQSYGSATAYGNQAYGQASSYALKSYSRQSKMRIVLVDVNTRETAWLGDAKTEGLPVSIGGWVIKLRPRARKESRMAEYFNANEEERLLMAKIAKRAYNDLKMDVFPIMMSLEAVHCGGVPLDLEALKNAPIREAIHDCAGICYYVDKENGGIVDHFRPYNAVEA